MGRPFSDRGKTVRAYIDKYNGRISKKKLASIIFKENPGLFSDVEEIRLFIRNHTGSSGSKSISSNTITWDIPEGDTEDFSDFIMPLSSNNVLILSDIHFPYHNKISLEKALNHGIKNNCNAIILNGDSLDCYYLSDHEKSPNKRNFSEELMFFELFLQELKKNFNVPIYFKHGNHEFRWERFLLRNPQIWDMKEFELKTILKFGEKGINEIKSMQANVLGKFTIWHGHEYKFGGGVNPAKALFERTGKSGVCGHFHRPSFFRANNGNKILSYSLGCICDLSPAYLPHQRFTQTWEHGFGILQWDKENFEFQNIIL